MQAGDLIDSDVQAMVSRVLVNGIQREVRSWSIGRDLTNDLPDQVVGGTGVMQASGTIEWASKDVDSGALNPWNVSTGWIPMEGDRVEIYAGDPFTEWKQFTGVIDSTSGAIGGGIQSKIVDQIDRLSTVVNLPALMTGMPPLTVGGAWRRVGMSSLFTQNTILRKAGFYSTPRPEFGCVLDVPLISSNWPLVGEVTSCAKRSDASSAPDGYGSVWGGARADYTAIYTPSIAKDVSVPLQITLLRAQAHNGFGYVRVEYGSATKSVELHITATAAAIRVNNATVTSVPCSGDTICQLLHKSGVITLKTSQGQSVTVTAPTGATGPITRIVSAADAGARVAGMQVSHPTAPQHEFASLDFEPTALVVVGDMHAGSMILPAISGLTAREALEDIGSRTLRAMWIDETGKAQVVASDVLYERLPSQRITTLDDIRELSWERNLLSVRSEVRVSYSQPAVTARTAPAVEAWHASDSVVLGSNETHEVIIEPGADEDWIMPDTQWEVLGRMFFNDMNKGIGSVCGGVLTDGVSENWASEPANDVLTVTVSGLAANKFMLKHTTKTLPAGKQVELRTISANFVGATGLWPYQWDQQMPSLKANAVAKWTTVERTPTVAGTRGPVLEHDCGKWITGHDSAGNVDTTAVDALASFLAMQVTDPKPTITGMTVGFDPRRQLGDVIIISSPGLLGIELRCLIVGINNQAGPDGYAQSLSVRVISAETTFTTYDEFVEAWGLTANYDAFIAAWSSTATYNDFNQDPLRGTE